AGTPPQPTNNQWNGSGRYGWNYCYLGAWPGQTFTLAQVTMPAECTAVGESLHTVNPGVVYPAPLCAGNPSWSGAITKEKDRLNYWGQFAFRHGGGSNLVFVDGHSKWYKREAIEQHPELFYSI